MHIYAQSLALLSDLYELTMAYGYWKKGLADTEAVFHLFFRKKPFGGGFAVAAGLETALDYLSRFRFEASDLAYLQSLRSIDDRPLFEEAFLDFLSHFSFSCDIDAVPEGTPIFPYEPLVRVRGPIVQAQLLESPLLNIINFQTLIATKAARICFAAAGDPVVEFGLRRAQGIDGALSASRAAYIGGCQSTSNVLAGKLFDIPVKGTHAHSWIMLFEEEEASFHAFADVLPHGCIFLIDTYDTVKGVRKAIRAADVLRKKGVEMLGVRLDSGDIAQLSIEIRKILDQAGYTKAKIMASNELDEYLIRDLKQQGARVDFWGVGTHLVTGREQPALDGVYKLSAVRPPGGSWSARIKISEQLAKVTNPGILQVRRYYDETGYIADMMYDMEGPLEEPSMLIDSFDPTCTRVMTPDLAYKDLLIPVIRQGKQVYNNPSIHEIQKRAQHELNQLHPSMRRFLNPQPYFTGLEKTLYELKLSLIKKIKELP